MVSGSTTDVASITGVAFEPSLVLAGVSTPTSVRGTGHWGGDSDDEMWEESSKGSFSSESEDDLPAIDLSVKESISGCVSVSSMCVVFVCLLVIFM